MSRPLVIQLVKCLLKLGEDERAVQYFREFKRIGKPKVSIMKQAFGFAIFNQLKKLDEKMGKLDRLNYKKKCSNLRCPKVKDYLRKKIRG